MDLIEKFLKYVSFETTAIEDSDNHPSNEKEYNLLNELKDELTSLGLDAFIKNGFVYSKIKSDTNKTDSIFLMAHVDTSPDAKGYDIKPRIVKYTGEDIILNENRNLNERDFPSLKKHTGHDLIVTDGNTLLGADDKAGIAIIMDTVEYLLKRGNYPNIIICFSPDEEIGMGTYGIDLDYIKNGENRIYAYTIDGGDINAFEYENFNAAHARVKVIGTSIHPSIGKNKLVNAMEVMMKFHDLLPKCRPENTEKREGFIHLTGASGEVESAQYDYILRSFDKDELESYKNEFYKAQNIINEMYHKNIVSVSINDQYKNMVEVINKNRYVIDLVHKAYDNLGIELVDEPIRGGTDGATLSHMGLPCPNLPTGGDNFHGVFEYLDIDDCKKVKEILINMIDMIE